jgi:uncharacterized protein (DUF927 family)
MDNAQWCVWRREERGGKPTKVPYNPMTGQRAQTDDPSTFSTFDIADEAFRIYGNYDGVGIRVSNGFSAIDIDHCITDGELSDLAKDICKKINSYTEKSPSGTGLRIIVKGEDLSYDRSKYYLKNPNNGVEFYVSDMTNRFMTITGNTLIRQEVRHVEYDELLDFLDQYMSRQKSKAPSRLSDEQIISKASQNEKFSALFNGDMTAYNNDHSSADLALCNILAFWTGKDAGRIDALFRKSALYRDKWEREDYRSETLRKAIDNCTDVYDPTAARKIWDRLDVPYLEVGEWTVDNGGVSREQIVKREPVKAYATSTPIAPAAFLEGHDSGLHKVELHYLRDNVQRSVVCERETIANKNKILSLANYGINVTSNDASELVRYLSDMERLNSAAIPHYTSIARMGWVGNKFVPYDRNIKFDGEEENRPLFRAVAKSGDYDAWVKFMAKLRENLYMRLIMAASFASPLIERVNALPFVFHLWGKTGKGKTVALMAAMSIWGDPRPGKLTRTMNMTNAAMMSTAAFLNNLPFAGDELQTIKNDHTSYDKLIMQITEGIERGRMQYSKNLAVRSWNCAFLFTGEEPCTNARSGGGTKNRVFEVNYSDAIIENGAEVVRFISKNHGSAGEKYIKYVSGQDLSSDYDNLVSEIMDSCDTTDKQAAVAALILLADKLACECIFKDEKPLRVNDVAPFVKTDNEVSTSKRAYDYIAGWVAANSDRFGGGSYGETWGTVQHNSVFIIDSVLSEALEEKSFSFDAVKKDWADQGWLVRYRDKFKKRKTINGVAPYCVEIILPDASEVER